MNAILTLEEMGYSFLLEGDDIRYSFPMGQLDPLQARRLLDEVKADKAEAVRFLRWRTLTFPVRVPIAEIPAFREAYGYKILGFKWESGGKATLIIEPA